MRNVRRGNRWYRNTYGSFVDAQRAAPVFIELVMHIGIQREEALDANLRGGIDAAAVVGGYAGPCRANRECAC